MRLAARIIAASKTIDRRKRTEAVRVAESVWAFAELCLRVAMHVTDRGDQPPDPIAAMLAIYEAGEGTAGFEDGEDWGYGPVELDPARIARVAAHIQATYRPKERITMRLIAQQGRSTDDHEPTRPISHADT